MMKLTSRTSLVLTGAAFIGLALAAQPQPGAAATVPCSAVRLIVPANAGGTTDTLGRIMADTVKRLGATPPIQVVNIGGQATMKGTIEAAKSRPDGCTLLVTHESLLQAPIVSGAPVSHESFEPIVQLTSNPTVVAAGSATPFTKVQDLIAAAKEKPTTVLAGASLGGASHFALLTLQNAAGVSFKYVSYNGAQEALTALLGNHIQIVGVQPSDVQQGIKTGQIKPLVVLSAKRIELMPDVPTASEVGYKITGDLTHSIYAPKGTSAEVIEHYRALFEKVGKDATFVTQIRAVGSEPSYLDPAELKKSLAAKQALFADIAKRMDMLPK